MSCSSSTRGEGRVNVSYGFDKTITRYSVVLMSIIILTLFKNVNRYKRNHREM